jgi:ribosome-binding protein aMBF1 (putative translation factor)
MSTTAVTYGDRLQSVRELSGLSREQIAAEVHRCSNTVANWESGRTHPARSVRVHLASLLNEPSLIELNP